RYPLATKSLTGIPGEHPSEGKSFAQVVQVTLKPITETTNSPIFMISPFPSDTEINLPVSRISLKTSSCFALPNYHFHLLSWNDLTHHLLDLIHRPRGFFDMGTSPHPDVHFELSGINRGKEILSEKSAPSKASESQA